MTVAPFPARKLDALQTTPHGAFQHLTAIVRDVSFLFQSHPLLDLALARVAFHGSGDFPHPVRAKLSTNPAKNLCTGVYIRLSGVDWEKP